MEDVVEVDGPSTADEVQRVEVVRDVGNVQDVVSVEVEQVQLEDDAPSTVPLYTFLHQQNVNKSLNKTQ